jgi:hypothetical protein
MASCRWRVVALVTVGFLAGRAAWVAADGAPPPVTVARARALKAAEQRLLFEEMQARLERYRARIRRRKPAGIHPRRPPDAAEAGDDPGRAGGRPELARTGLTSAYPNVAVNHRASDTAPSSGQAEVAIAAFGNNLVATFNDGEGFFTGASIQGYSWSTDGGLTWTDGGIPPTANIGTWAGDPALAVNEKTGEFYLAGLCQPASGSNGIGVVKGTFGGGSFAWGMPELAISGASSSVIYDKEWIAADSTSGNVYLVYARFAVAGDTIATNRIDVQRKVGALPFEAPTTLSSAGDAGRAQGARVAVGPDGDVWAAWFAVGPTDADFMRVRRSTRFGAGWGPQSTAVSHFTNFGTGAPGFNRGEGFSFPALAVDRTPGSHRGRVYLAWNESINFYDDLLGQNGSVAESEPNDSPAAADTFTIGQTLTGSISPGGENDYWSFAGSEGQTIICQLHATAPLDATFRLLCGDDVSRLAFSRSGVGGEAVIVFTLPGTGTYTLRVAAGSGSGAYSVVTGFNTPGPERSRDHRDVFVCASDDNITWSTPSLVNDDAPHFDNWFPEIAVGDGRPYVIWFDWRDAPVGTCGAVSSIYSARSDDGGASWTSLGPVSDAQSAWTSVSSNIIPNQGDYIALFGSTTSLHPAWGDGRNGDPDVYTATIPLNTTAVQGAPSASTGLAIQEVRPNPVDRELTVTFTLAGSGPARLDLLDVSGRRMSERSVAGAGLQTVALAGAGEFPPGVYLLRLTQGGHSVVKRVSVLH